jgi:type VI secretion system protein ImpF
MAYNLVKHAQAEPKRQVGAPIPLFERLIDEDPLERGETPIKRYYTKEDLQESIQREVLRILGTRSSLKRADLGGLAEEALNTGFPPLFGLSDFSQYDAARTTDQPRIAQLCREAITRYEPRLTDVQVFITGFDRQTANLSGSIAANLVSEVFQGEVSFPIMLKIRPS